VAADGVAAAVAAIQAGEPVILPTDTVYGLCGTPHRPAAATAVTRLKGRDDAMPLAVLAAAVDALLEVVPELEGRAAEQMRALLPGPLTLVLPNPARRLSWLTGGRPDTIGARVPVLPDDTRAVLARVGAVIATSANRHGGPDPRSLDDVPAGIRAACAAEIDGGELPGTPSTVLDLTGDQPRVLREGAMPAAEALARAASA
jgi:L-threonylcarbamoyladenylate synthase